MLLAAAAAVTTEPSIESADALFKANKWAEAEQEYRQLLNDPDSAIHAQLRLGYCLSRQRKDEEAIVEFRKILDHAAATPGEIAQAKLRIGYSMRMIGQQREAIPVLLEAAGETEASSTTRAEALLYAAWAHGVLGEHDEAIAVFRKVEKIPEVHGNYAATASLSIGRTLQDRGEFEEAIAEFEKIETYHPVAAGNKSRARIYILECEALLAGDNPFHIRPWVSEVGPDNAKIFWVSQGEAPAGLVVHEGANGKSEASITVSPIKGTTCNLHTVELTGLTEGTLQKYHVRCGDESSEGEFRTAPAAGSAFSFTVIGDTQSYHPQLQQLLDLMGEEDADFTIHVGDLVDRGDIWGEWKAGFFDPGHSYMRDAALWPVFGNHDGGPFYPAFFKRETGLYYSFDWGDAHFVMLDSYGPGSGGTGRAAQLEWLEADLAANDKRWTIVSLHVPMIATREAIPKFGQDDFLPILERHGVDIVFSGHHPHYRRYRPIGPEGGKPILHITTGGGGGPVGGSLPSPLLVRGVDKNHFTRVTIDGDTLKVVAKSIEDEVVDEFELEKSGEDFGKAWMDSAIPLSRVPNVISFYHELLEERTHRLILHAAEEPGKLRLNLATLPRGAMDVAKLPEGAELEIESTAESAVKIARQRIPLAEGFGLIESEGEGTKAEVVIRLIVQDEEFEPFQTESLIRAK